MPPSVRSRKGQDVAIRPMDEFDLNLKEDDEYLVLVGKQQLRRALLGARMELQKRHLEHKNLGELVRILPDEKAIATLIYEEARKAIGPAPDVQD